MSHIMKLSDSGKEVLVGHYTPVYTTLTQMGSPTSRGGDFVVLKRFDITHINEAASWVNYLNGGLGINPPDVDFIVAELIRAIKLNPPGG